MVSSSSCGDRTNADPGSRESVAVRPATVCAHPHSAPIGGRENRMRRGVTELKTSRNPRAPVLLALTRLLQHPLVQRCHLSVQ